MPVLLLWVNYYLYLTKRSLCSCIYPVKAPVAVCPQAVVEQYIVKWLLWFVVLVCPFSSFAQAAPSTVPIVIPPAPTAAALEKYGLVPVSTYTGVPNISLPLYEIKVRDITLPLSLSYHAGGFRVTEEASWVGLGWSLQAGGVLTHTTRNLDDLTWFVPRNGFARYGMPDCTPVNDLTSGGGFGIPSFLGDPYTGATTIMASGGSGLSPQIATYVQGKALPYAVNGVYQNAQVDWEPDEYRFTMGNYSGAFVFDQQGAIHLLEAQQQVRISYAYAANTGQVVWTVQTPDGFRYEFTAPEVTSSLGTSTTSAWYLTRVISPLGEEVTLSYETGPSIYNQPAFTQTEIKQQQYSAQPSFPPATGYSAGATVPQYLRRIDFKTGYVLFERDAVLRKDLQGGQRLKRVAVYSKTTGLLKAFDLQASYFDSPSSSGYLTTFAGWSSNLDSAKVYESKRLRLDAVWESGQNGETKPPTRLAYNATALPVKSSYSVDYWGYYNGRPNTSLIPRYAGPDLSGVYVVYPGADRTAAAEPMQAAILHSITYPTGGTTTFTFEPHAYGNLTEEEDQLEESTVSFRMQADNVSTSPYDPTSQIIRVDAPTPLSIDYILSVETGGDLDQKKARTTLQLIDSTTNKPFTSGSVDLGNYVQAQWGFSATSKSTPSSPYSPANMVQVSGHVDILLPAGSYTLTGYTPLCSSSDVGACHATVFAQGTYPIQHHLQSSSIQQLLAGGLRVKRIELTDPLDATHPRIQVFAYGADSTTAAGQAITTSNGVLLNHPIFSKVVKYFYAEQEKFWHELTSFSQVALSAGARGSTVGYTQVSVLEGAQGEGGKTVYAYYCHPDATVRYQDRQPNVPSRPDELNGSLLSQATYQHDASGFHVVNSTTNTYESVLDPRYHYDVPAVFQGETFIVSANGTGGDSKARRLYFYPIPVNWVRLISTTNQQYSTQLASRNLATTTRYTYDTLQTGHMQLSQVRTRRSDGSTQLTLSTYPADYTSVTTGFLAAMRGPDNYQPTAVVETRTLVYGPGETAAAAKTIAGSYTSYTKPTTTSGYLPAVVGQLALAQPQATGGPTAPPTLPDLRQYPVQHYLQYSASANVEQAHRAHELPIVYLWGYSSTLPIAQIKGVSLAQAQAALGVDPNTLVTDEQIQAAMQRMRQQLSQAQVTSFTYRPLVGITSQTDPSGRTTNYEYDGLGRLVRTRDEQGRILSQQQYHYAGQ